MWAQLEKIPNFFLLLEKTSYADEIVSTALSTGAEVCFLTALPRKSNAQNYEEDKRLWVSQHYSGIPIKFGPYSKDKHNHAKPGDVLIDDRPRNIWEWKIKNGIGFFHDHSNYLATIKFIKSLINI